MNLKMMVVQGKPKGKCLTFPIGEYIVGRGEECHVRPNSPWVSRQHCLLLVSETACTVRDLGSCNGTLLNGERIFGELPIDTGDCVQIGPLVLEVVESEATVNEDQQLTLAAPQMR